VDPAVRFGGHGGLFTDLGVGAFPKSAPGSGRHMGLTSEEMLPVVAAFMRRYIAR
jgi:hypothetical protein